MEIIELIIRGDEGDITPAVIERIRAAMRVVGVTEVSVAVEKITDAVLIGALRQNGIVVRRYKDPA